MHTYVSAQGTLDLIMYKNMGRFRIKHVVSNLEHKMDGALNGHILVLNGLSPAAWTKRFARMPTRLSGATTMSYSKLSRQVIGLVSYLCNFIVFLISKSLPFIGVDLY